MPGHGWRVSIRNIISGNFNCEKFLYFSILLTSGLPAFPGIFNHMNRLLSLLLFVGSLSCYGQINFEKGYVITNGGEREQVWIRNVGWKDNPEVFTFKTPVMPIVKVIELIASSEKGIEDAIQNALAEASKTIHNIDSIFVKDIKVQVKDNKISSYGIICKVSFRLDGGR